MPFAETEQAVAPSDSERAGHVDRNDDDMQIKLTAER